MLKALLSSSLLLAVCLFAQESETPEAPFDYQAYAQEIESTLDFKKGEITLDDGLATLQLGEDFRYLDPKGASKVLVELWGNPQGQENLGMIFPQDCQPSAQECYGIIIQYEEEGYVKDDDAKDIDYSELLGEMQESTLENNEGRLEMGAPKVELVGWAESPYYDKVSHKLHWAKELKFDDSPASDHTLNYNLRILGRKGVLIMNVVAGMQQMPLIKERMLDINSLATFNEGHRYEDFDEDSDPVAAYGIAALVGGKVLAKAGFFKVIIAAIIAGKKFVIIGAIALFAFFRRFLSGEKKKDEIEEV